MVFGGVGAIGKFRCLELRGVPLGVFSFLVSRGPAFGLDSRGFAEGELLRKTEVLGPVEGLGFITTGRRVPLNPKP